MAPKSYPKLRKTLNTIKEIQDRPAPNMNDVTRSCVRIINRTYWQIT